MITANYISEDTEMAVFVKYHFLKLNEIQSKILISVFVSVSALISAKKILAIPVPAIPAKANTVTGLIISYEYFDMFLIYSALLLSRRARLNLIRFAYYRINCDMRII